MDHLNNPLRKQNIRNESNYGVLRSIAIFYGATTLSITTFSIRKYALYAECQGANFTYIGTFCNRLGQML